VLSGDKRALALVALVALVAHATALGGGFVWLDHSHIQDGLALAPAGDWLGLFGQGFAGTGFYRPLMALSLSLDAALGGGTVLYHATTLLWHAAAAVLVVLAAEALGLSRRAALIAGVLFAVHPLTSLVASAIAFRSEAMIAAALLGLIVLHRRGRPLAAALVLLAGALTKETALVLGVLAIAALELERRTEPPLRWRLLGAEAAAAVVAVGLRLFSVREWRAAHVGLGAGEAVGTRLAALARSALAIVPVDRSLCDAFPITPLASGRALVGALLLAAVIVGARRRRGPALLLALSLLPALQLVPIMRWWSPHYLYVPFCFLAMLIGEALALRGRRTLAAAAAVAAVLAVVTALDDLRFRNDGTLWSTEVARQPACREGQFYLGVAALEQKRVDEAALHLERAVAGDPRVLSYVDRGAALQNLGVARLEQGQLEPARTSLRAALDLVTVEAARRQISHDLAAVELRAGQPAEAVRLLEVETARPDAFPQSIFLHARALHDLGREREAAVLVHRLQAGGHIPGGPVP
jgi:tetratricopeptide (TPR) repeat protein